MINLSMYGVDIMNGLMLSIFKCHKIDYMRSNSDEMSKLALIYANFLLGSCLNLDEKNFSLAYKKFKTILNQVYKML